MLVMAFFSIFSLTFLWSEVTSVPVEAAVIEESVDATCANSVLGLVRLVKSRLTMMEIRN